jgi:hypothetical protein
MITCDNNYNCSWILSSCILLLFSDGCGLVLVGISIKICACSSQGNFFRALLWNESSVQVHSHDYYSYIRYTWSQGPEMFNYCPNAFHSSLQWPPWRKHADCPVEPLVRKYFSATITEKSTCRSTMPRLQPLHNEAYECQREYLESHQQQGRRRARIPFSDD